MSTIIDTRFAGGHTTVTTTPSDPYLVRVEFPRHSVDLFPHEARELAAALHASADVAALLKRADSTVTAPSTLEPAPVSGDELARVRAHLENIA